MQHVTDNLYRGHAHFRLVAVYNPKGSLFSK